MKVVQIRKAELKDARGIAEVHVASWLTTYKGIVPDQYLASLSIDEQELRWQGIIEASETKKWVFVAENNAGEIVGFISGGANRFPDEFPEYDGELYAIYLLKAYQGQGIGSDLFKAFVRKLEADQMKRMIVLVLAKNDARYFYQRLGAHYLTAKKLDFLGEELDEEVYAWRTI